MKVKAAQSCLTLCDPIDYAVHGILQARILERVAFPFSRGSSQPRDQTQVSCIAGGMETESMYFSCLPSLPDITFLRFAYFAVCISGLFVWLCGTIFYCMTMFQLYLSLHMGVLIISTFCIDE